MTLRYDPQATIVAPHVNKPRSWHFISIMNKNTLKATFVTLRTLIGKPRSWLEVLRGLNYVYGVFQLQNSQTNYFQEEKRSDFFCCHYSIEIVLQHVYYTNVIANVNRTLLKTHLMD